MTQPRFCPRCRNPLATDAPSGLCPGCLFELALEPSTVVPDAPFDSDPTLPAFDPVAAAGPGARITNCCRRSREAEWEWSTKPGS
jgi:predicted amidophosphoribosyltransferase